MSFSIITDTSANLPSPLVEAYDVKVVPFSYFIDGVEHTCVDTEAFDGKGFYDTIRSGTVVSTSLITPYRYTAFMRPILKRGQDILFVGMSSGISSSFRSAQTAAAHLRKEFPNRTIELVDTLGASLGEGIPVLEAVKCRASGMSIADAAESVRRKSKRMYQVFVVDDLMHLRRTGRCSNASAIMGTVLQIKPLLKGDEKGKIVTFDKFRGRRRAIDQMAARYEELVEEAVQQTVGIAHADCEKDALRLAQMLNKIAPPKEIITVMYEPVTGSHVGPGTLALFFEGGDDVREK